METNYFQIVAEMIALFMPVILISLLRVALNEVTAYLLLLVTGLAFIALYNLWIRNIYKRFMKRRYINMEAFRYTK